MGSKIYIYNNIYKTGNALYNITASIKHIEQFTFNFEKANWLNYILIQYFDVSIILLNMSRV